MIRGEKEYNAITINCVLAKKEACRKKKKIRLTNFLLFINVKRKKSYYLLDKSPFVNVPESLPCA